MKRVAFTVIVEGSAIISEPDYDYFPTLTIYLLQAKVLSKLRLYCSVMMSWSIVTSLVVKC